MNPTKRNPNTVLFFILLMSISCWSDNLNQWERVAVILTSEQGLSNLDKPLKYSEKDGREVAEVLQSAGQLEEKNIYRIHENNPTLFKEKILKIKESILKKDKKIFLQVYYSGHGSANHLHIGDSKIPFDFVKANLGKNIADARMYILDVCYGASFFNSKGFKKLKPIELGFDLGEWTNGEVLISSSAQNEQSFETKKLEGSIFTSHWLMALRGAADQNQDGLISLFEAYNYTYDQTVRYSTESLQIPQHPSYSMDINSGKDLILSRPLKSNSSLILKKLTPGIYSINDLSRNVPLGEIRLTEKTNYNLALAPGKYSLNRFNTNDIKETQNFTLSTSPIEIENENFKEFKSFNLQSKGSEKNDSPDFPNFQNNETIKKPEHSFFIGYGYGISGAHIQDALKPFKFNRETEDYFKVKRDINAIDESNSWSISAGLILENFAKLYINVEHSRRTFNTTGLGEENLFGLKKPIPVDISGQGALYSTFVSFSYEHPFHYTSYGELGVALGLGPSFNLYYEDFVFNRPLAYQTNYESSEETLTGWHFKTNLIWEYPLFNIKNSTMNIVLNSGIIFNLLKSGSWTDDDDSVKWAKTTDIIYTNQFQLRWEW